MIEPSGIEIEKENHPADLGGSRKYASIKYRVKVPRRDDSGFGTLVMRCVDEQEFTGLLPQLRGLNSGAVFAQIVDFFPNGYLSWPQQPTKKDERRTRHGVGSFLLEEMLRDAGKEFSAKAIGAFRCSPSFCKFLGEKGFVMIYGGAYYKLL